MAASTLHLPSRLAPASPPTTSAVPRSGPFIPTMPDIEEAARAQNLRLELRTLGPFFRVRGLSLDKAGAELGRAEGVVRPWAGGWVLHLDSMRMSRATLGMERSIFGLGLFVGAAAVRHGFDRGCRRAELLAINDTDLYHSKLVRFYRRMGFRAVREVDGSSAGDLPHLLVWGGRGTRMDAGVEELLAKWGGRFRPPPRS
ncbi:hypothetical protein Taro_002523 [Colocasia esculenta]|uniref:N-acetyltransferase domain-containing protein n=1 Tax=Colocasia esculenta TaxID=4460 RepID=A0A843TLU2_COLES|nr:hypothetical protein [Colocasia esculenta]